MPIPVRTCEEMIPSAIAPTAADTFLELRYFGYARRCKVTPNRPPGMSGYTECESAVFHTVQVREDGSILFDGVVGEKQLTDEETARVRTVAFEGLRFADLGSPGPAPVDGGRGYEDACASKPPPWVGLDGQGLFVFDKEALGRIERLLAVPALISSAGE